MPERRGRCIIGRADSRTTTIQIAFDVSAGWVATEVGVTKMYKIQRTAGADVDTSGWLFARWPYTTGIYGHVEG